MHINLADSDVAIRFRNAVERLNPSRDSRILLAVSGGPDSVAMLLLAHSTMPERIAAATVDHTLRPESAHEAAFVARLCAERRIAHRILTPDQPITGNVQSAARAARYALLHGAADAMQCDLIATAHHDDDQLETLLMRIARGSGVAGLAGIRARNGQIIRPLLGFTKADLEKICADGGVQPVHDPSNADAAFDRVAMRQFLASQPHPFDPARASRTASALSDAEDALGWMIGRLAIERLVVGDETVTVDPVDLPKELQRRLLIIAVQTIAPGLSPRGDAVERLLGNLHAGKNSTIGDILCKGGAVWQLAPGTTRQTG